MVKINPWEHNYNTHAPIETSGWWLLDSRPPTWDHCSVSYQLYCCWLKVNELFVPFSTNARDSYIQTLQHTFIISALFYQLQNCCLLEISFPKFSVSESSNWNQTFWLGMFSSLFYQLCNCCWVAISFLSPTFSDSASSNWNQTF